VFRDSVLVTQIPKGPDANLLEWAHACLVSAWVWAVRVECARYYSHFILFFLLSTWEIHRK
jgi:hypothetical protein